MKVPLRPPKLRVADRVGDRVRSGTGIADLNVTYLRLLSTKTYHHISLWRPLAMADPNQPNVWSSQSLDVCVMHRALVLFSGESVADLLLTSTLH